MNIDDLTPVRHLESKDSQEDEDHYIVTKLFVAGERIFNRGDIIKINKKTGEILSIFPSESNS